MKDTTTADTFHGGSGNDTFNVDHVGDVVIEDLNAGVDTIIANDPLPATSQRGEPDPGGSADLQGYGNSLGNFLYGNSGNNILNGDAGADVMVGGAGNDAYFVDHFADAVFENANEGTDTVYSTAHFRLSENVENLILQGSADLQGYGNGLANAIFGSSGNDLLDGGAGADWMSGGQGNDAYFVDNPGDWSPSNLARGSIPSTPAPTIGWEPTSSTWCCKAVPTCRGMATIWQCDLRQFWK